MLHEGPTSRREKRILLGLFCCVLLIGGVLWMRTNKTQGYGRAAIDCDGKRVAVLNLASYTDTTRIAIQQFGVDLPVNFELQEHQIRFVDVTCPDKLCEGFGFLKLPTQTAVCMPNRVSISILAPF